MKRASRKRRGGGVVGEHRLFVVGHANRKPEAERFWRLVKRVDGDGCWEWAGSRNKNSGHGHFNRRAGVGINAQRMAWILTHGDPGPQFVLHKCDNAPCVRPSHLYLGDQKENMAGCSARGRSARGERCANAKLSEAAVVDIRHRIREGGESQGALARFYGTHRCTISDIMCGKSWRHVPWPS